jgi:hypothetical protein
MRAFALVICHLWPQSFHGGNILVYSAALASLDPFFLPHVPYARTHICSIEGVWEMDLHAHCAAIHMYAHAWEHAALSSLHSILAQCLL